MKKLFFCLLYFLTFNCFANDFLYGEGDNLVFNKVGICNETGNTIIIIIDDKENYLENNKSSTFYTNKFLVRLLGENKNLCYITTKYDKENYSLLMVVYDPFLSIINYGPDELKEALKDDYSVSSK